MSELDVPLAKDHVPVGAADQPRKANIPIFDMGLAGGVVHFCARQRAMHNGHWILIAAVILTIPWLDGDFPLF